MDWLAFAFLVLIVIAVVASPLLLLVFMKYDHKLGAAGRFLNICVGAFFYFIGLLPIFLFIAFLVLELRTIQPHLFGYSVGVGVVTKVGVCVNTGGSRRSSNWIQIYDFELEGGLQRQFRTDCNRFQSGESVKLVLSNDNVIVDLVDWSWKYLAAMVTMAVIAPFMFRIGTGAARRRFARGLASRIEPS